MSSLIITATEAQEKTSNSIGALKEHLKRINTQIIAQTELGKSEAWVEIPTNSLENEIKDELKLLGYIIHNRNSFKVLISW